MRSELKFGANSPHFAKILRGDANEQSWLKVIILVSEGALFASVRGSVIVEFAPFEREVREVCVNVALFISLGNESILSVL